MLWRKVMDVKEEWRRDEKIAVMHAKPKVTGRHGWLGVKRNS